MTTKNNEINNKLKSIFKSFQTITVVGGNWGDEGKGKIIDLVMRQYDMAVRFSGGANAGHTVYTNDGKKLVGHLIPCGLAQSKTCVLARGELIDLKLFCAEYEEAKKLLKGKMPKVFLDKQSPVWTPWHGMFESWLEMSRGKTKVGTTGKGIGPLEGLHRLRISPVLGQIFLKKEDFVETLDTLYKAFLPIFEQMKKQNAELAIPNPSQVADELIKLGTEIKEKVIDTSHFLHEEMGKGKRMLFEGAQAMGLDNTWGTYPFVTAGNTTATGASLGSGLSMQNFKASIMVAKTLPSRVGEGPFVSEMWDRKNAMLFAKENLELFTDKEKKKVFLEQRLKKINQGKTNFAETSQYFQVLGDERGATTGRGRSLGFLDIPWLLYANRINNPTFIALTRFDMLSKVKSIPVVVAYKFKGKILPKGSLPAPWEMSQIEPVFENWQCFLEDISGINEEKKLPKNAREFLGRLEKRIERKILFVGTGPGREDIVIRK